MLPSVENMLKGSSFPMISSSPKVSNNKDHISSLYPLVNLASETNLKEYEFTQLLENPAFEVLHSSNVFASQNEKDIVYRMAELADLAYSGMENLEEVSRHFPKGLIPLPTAQDLGVTFPTGLYAQAYRHGNQILLTIRGTNLGKDVSTSLANVIADAGIGRHKTNEQIIGSVHETFESVRSRYGDVINSDMIGAFDRLVANRVVGHNESDRSIEVIKRIGSSILEGGFSGGKFGGLIAGTLGLCGVAAGLTALPIAGTITLAASVSGALFYGGASAVNETIKCTTAMDGYPNILAYVAALDDYRLALMNLKGPNDKFIVVGHSLAGFLCPFIDADEYFAFNSPGAKFDVDVKEVFKNLKRERPIRENVVYNSYSMEADFIGNFCPRSGKMHKLCLPILFGEQLGSVPPCEYNNLLSHHGIKLMKGVIANSMVASSSSSQIGFSDHTPLLLGI